MSKGAPRCRLYLLTPPAIEPAAFAPLLEEALNAGDVAALQIRLKGIDDDAIRRAVAVLRPIAQSRDVAVILNDRPDLAAATGCDGVHIGAEDLAYAPTRKIVGPDAIVGVSCYDSRHLAMVAGEAGADYVAFGAFFPSTTKEKPIGHPEPDILSWWSELMEVPCVAIGGITPENCRPLVEASADFLAVNAGVWDHAGGPAEAVRAFNRVFDEVAAAR